MINMIYMNTVNYSCLRNNQPKLTSVVIICCNFFRHKKGYAIFVGIAYPSWLRQIVSTLFCRQLIIICYNEIGIIMNDREVFLKGIDYSYYYEEVDDE